MEAPESEGTEGAESEGTEAPKSEGTEMGKLDKQDPGHACKSEASIRKGQHIFLNTREGASGEETIMRGW